jgi:glycosyltransferase involved in cell wall biosynthesis
MKVVWLCHFANQEVKDHFKTPHVEETAPWIINLIELIRTRKDIELHIVSPNIFSNRRSTFYINRVTYHFYEVHSRMVPGIVSVLLSRLFSKDYTRIQTRINGIIEEIQPEIIHLHGAENPYYSAGIIPLIGKYPILLTIQGFARNSSLRNTTIKKCIQIEEQIISKINHFGVRTQEMCEIILSINHKAQLHYHNYPVTIPQYIKNNESIFDIIYFARLSKDKGIEDLLQALALLKKEKMDISLHIVGTGGKLYKYKLIRIIKALKIESNVVWAGFMKNQQDVFKYSANAKICVLPTYHDSIPGTIIESMFMKLPVVAYAVGGIPELNSKEETILLVEKNNISQLAVKISQLLNNTDLQNTLAEKAFFHIRERNNNKTVINDIVDAYNSILLEKCV